MSSHIITMKSPVAFNNSKYIKDVGEKLKYIGACV